MKDPRIVFLIIILFLSTFLLVINDAKATSIDKSVKIVKNDVIAGDEKASSNEWPASDAYSSYGNATDLWGLSWNSSDINADNFGVAIASNITGPNKDRTASIGHIRITVYYSSQDICA